MFSYVIRKILYSVPVIWGVVTVVFILMAVVPGDPARLMMGQRGDPATLARIRADLGLDLPLHRQYFRFLGDMARGDLGTSYRNNERVTTALASRFGATLRLAFWAMVVAAVIGVAAGILSAVKQYSLFDYSAMFIAISGVSAPVFWVGLLLLLVFAYGFHIIPGVGYGDGDWRYLVLPVITLGVRPAALIARLTRSCMLEVMSQDYIRTARAKGLAERVVILKHAFKNALIPVVTIIGTQVAELLSGAVLTETIFAWPGVGRLAVEALVARDFPMIRGTVIFMALLFLVANLLVDLSYGFIDPRIRYD
ncbi:ABC transporter permease [Aminithiophilus ramosus]|uniref:ABC transporter permease n=1 Tax=Aminithiophilus ramosus TaxID=3029084 RepID=A0A9Q7EYF6_9BACT|nr:ABC transporter permease [Aminithiophilus ramosus]QTX31961.1 ABC transporter permease [Aminithiophilus ramosus]